MRAYSENFRLRTVSMPSGNRTMLLDFITRKRDHEPGKRGLPNGRWRSGCHGNPRAMAICKEPFQVRKKHNTIIKFHKNKARRALKELATCTPPPSANKAAHSGFETQRGCHQKSKAEVSVAPQKELMSPEKL